RDWSSDVCSSDLPHILLAHRTHKLQRLIETIFIDVKVRGRHTQPSRISLLTELLTRKPTEVPTIRLDILQTNLTKTIQHRLLTTLINPRDQREHLDRHLISRNRHTIRIRVLTIGAELMRPLSSSTFSKDVTFLGLGRDRHQPLTRVRTGIDDLAINQILHTLNLRNSERVILGTRLISERHILGSNLHRLRRLTRFTRLQDGPILI